ncbi:MAG: enoyl-CoA hydratase/isomerase family protein [Bacteroidales bacterium]|jgi:enoyl-CoA hydratase/carnithine racemase|nr:enoyl-CoA hydratase/isomerase family protein [Bacteroidales bacterium]
MDFKTISSELIHNNISILTLNNPEKYNSLNQLFFTEFENFIDKIEKNNDIRVLIIKGTNNIFSSGGDLKEMLNFDLNTSQSMCRRAQADFRKLIELEIPTIAMIDGLTYGGGFELALHCDIRFCSELAKFQFPETKFGLIPAAGGISLFSRYFSHADSAYFLFSNEEIPIEKLISRGVIQKQIENEKLLDFTLDFASKLCNISKEAIAKCKKIIYYNLFSNINDGMNMETLEFSSLLQYIGKEKIEKLFINKK